MILSKIFTSRLFIIILAAFLIFAAFSFMPLVPSEATVKTGFGQVRMEISGIDSKGQMHIFQMSSGIMGNLLSFYNEGVEVEQVNVKVFVEATGDGFDEVEFEFTDDWISTTTPEIMGRMRVSNHYYAPLGKLYDGDLNLVIPLDTETLLMEHTFDLIDFMDDFDEDQDHEMEMKIWFRMPECKFRGLTSGMSPGPWQTENVYVEIETASLEWNAPQTGPVCGDGVCENEPYPGENCMTCPGDCGAPNGRILPGDRLIAVEDSSLLSIDSNWYIQRSFYNGNSWEPWSQSNSNWQHVEVYMYDNWFCAYVYPAPNAVGKTLNGYCKVREIGETGNILSGWFDLPQAHPSGDWPNRLGDTVTSSDLSTGMTGYWKTMEFENHRFTHNGRYQMEIYYWLDGEGSPDPDPEPGQPLVNVFFTPPLPAGSKTGVVGYTLNDPDDATVDVEIDWGETIDTYNDLAANDNDHQHNNQFSQDYINSHAGVWVKVTATDKDNMKGWDESWLGFQWAQTAQMIPFFSMTDRSTHTERYEHNGRYLGV